MTEECIFSENCNRKDCEKAFCERKFRLTALFNKTLLTEAQRKHFTISLSEGHVDTKTYTELAEVAEHIEGFVASGQNLYLYSTTCGNGKSTWSIRLLEEYIHKIWAKVDLSCHALFISVPRFLLALKANITEPNEYAQQVLERVQEADLVIWDDIGAKVASEFELNHLLSIIETRLAAGKSNIYTTNIKPDSFATVVGDRLASRVVNLSIQIKFNGNDRRKAQVK